MKDDFRQAFQLFQKQPLCVTVMCNHRDSSRKRHSSSVSNAVKETTRLNSSHLFLRDIPLLYERVIDVPLYWTCQNINFSDQIKIDFFCVVKSHPLSCHKQIPCQSDNPFVSILWWKIIYRTPSKKKKESFNWMYSKLS